LFVIFTKNLQVCSSFLVKFIIEEKRRKKVLSDEAIPFYKFINNWVPRSFIAWLQQRFPTGGSQQGVPNRGFPRSFFIENQKINKLWFVTHKHRCTLSGGVRG
jgi:hypothetical protein